MTRSMVQDYPLVCDWGSDIARRARVKIRLCEERAVLKGFCEKHIPYTDRRQRDYDNTPQEKRQEYLNVIHQGKTIGEACEITGMDFDVALLIINNAIDDYKFLKRTAE